MSYFFFIFALIFHVFVRMMVFHWYPSLDYVLSFHAGVSGILESTIGH